MSDRKAHRYERQGLLAIEPRAFLGLFFEPPTRGNEQRGDIEVVGISGPLDHHAGWWCDSYDDICARVCAALDGPARAVVMRIDSPGGAVSGCFETARALRTKAEATGKKLVAYVEGQACSAAYALASSASRIVAAETSIVGSVGVIDTRVDATAADAAMGLRFSFVTSGAHKADGNPHTAFTVSELQEKQVIVDALAGVFFALVQDMRGVDAKPLEARVFVGRDALKAGLVDEVSSFEMLLETLSSAAQEARVASKYEEARAALEEAAKGEGEEAERAKRALAAMDESDEKKDDEDEDKAEHEEPDGDEEPKKDEEAKAAASVAASTAGDLAATVASLSKEVASLKSARDSEERKSLLASRPDLGPKLVSVLSSKPLAEVKAILDAMPKPSAPKPAATATVAATRGASQGDAGVTSTSADADALDSAFGLKSEFTGIRRDGTSVVYGVLSREQAAKIAEKAGSR